MSSIQSLDETLINLGQYPWTIRNAVEGVQIFGGIGSGKTTGSGRMLALKYLSAGFGGLVLTVKPDEKDLWVDYCRMTNRLNDLIIVEPKGDRFFNFLHYESSHSSDGRAETENIVEVLKTVIRASEEKSTGKSDDPFWESAMDILMFHVIDLCKLAYGFISIDDMYDIMQTLPRKPHSIESEKVDDEPKPPNAFERAFEAARQILNTKSAQLWINHPEKLEGKNEEERQVVYKKEIPEVRLMHSLDQFFQETYFNLAEKTRSIIEFSFSGFLFKLKRDPVYSLFCNSPSNFTPEASRQGKIILLNLPVKSFNKVGRDIQIMFKYIWQRAMERRIPNALDRTVFLWADEAQNFLHEHDSDYQATARSSRIATVYITQNLPNYLANMGGLKADHRVHGFLGTLNTKIFHANADTHTNSYASELFGESFFEERSYSSGIAQKDFSSSTSTNMRADKSVRAELFVRLKTGAAHNDYLVEGYVHCHGNLLKKSYIKIAFDQNFKP